MQLAKRCALAFVREVWDQRCGQNIWVTVWRWRCPLLGPAIPYVIDGSWKTCLGFPCPPGGPAAIIALDQRCERNVWVTVRRLLPLARWLAGVPPKAAHVGKVLPYSSGSLSEGFWQLLLQFTWLKAAAAFWDFFVTPLGLLLGPEARAKRLGYGGATAAPRSVASRCAARGGPRRQGLALLQRGLLSEGFWQLLLQATWLMAAAAFWEPGKLWGLGSLETWRLKPFWEPSGIRLGALREPPGSFVETLWGPSGNLLVGALWEHSGKFLGAFWDPSGCLLATKACLGPCLEPAWGFAWGLGGATPGREAPSGGKSPGWGLRPWGRPRGPWDCQPPRGSRGRAKPLGLGSLPLYAACIRYGYLWHCRGKAGSGPASPGPMRDARLGRSLSARTASDSQGG